jgi:NhaP-type Na+/H+ or K+/H+ antiporter
LRNFVIGGLGGLILGSVVASLEIVSLPYFYDDPIGEITITIAIPYMLYWLCKHSIHGVKFVRREICSFR